MTRLVAAALPLFLLACGERKQSEWGRATFHPAHRIELTGDAALSDWANAHAANDVQSLWISPVKATVRLAPLSQLKGLRALTLSGFADSTPTPKDGGFVFPAALSDAQVAEIVKVRTLRAIALWYGSFTKEQRETLRKELPDCELLENLNKI
ncbi:MAG TPA: hypothetical protein VNM14_11765 [Planctomycetota bacterium]|nr:hypothetical protein [Planctomycetota bacterium]